MLAKAVKSVVELLWLWASFTARDNMSEVRESI